MGGAMGGGMGGGMPPASGDGDRRGSVSFGGGGEPRPDGPLASVARVASRLMITHDKRLLEIEDETGAVRAVTVDGKPRKSTGPRGEITETASALDGAVVLESALGERGRVRWEYRLSPDGRRLMITTEFAPATGAEPARMRQVYDQPD